MSTNEESLEKYINLKLLENIFVKRAIEKGVMSIDCIKVVGTFSTYFINVTVMNMYDNSWFDSVVTIHDRFDKTQVKLGVNNIITQVEQEALIIML